MQVSDITVHHQTIPILIAPLPPSKSHTKGTISEGTKCQSSLGLSPSEGPVSPGLALRKPSRVCAGPVLTRYERDPDLHAPVGGQQQELGQLHGVGGLPLGRHPSCSRCFDPDP